MPQSSFRLHRRVTWAPVALCLVCLCGVPARTDAAGASVRAGTATSVQGWQQRLATVEDDLRRVSANDAAARDRIAQLLVGLRREISAALSSEPAARDASQLWLEPAGSLATVEDLAAEVSRLRATLSRMAAAGGPGGDEAAFYMGRVDVAVTAESTMSATTEMTPAGAAVINSKEIEAHGRSSLSTALSLAPGVTFTRVGQRNETTVYVRGFDMRQVPLFIDGIPVYTPYDGYADLDRFTTFDVAELRVSKGFSSVLYGPNALGGAINIISRRPSDRLSGIAGAGLGLGPSRSAFINIGSRLNAWYLQGSASYLTSDTFPLPADFPGSTYQPAGGGRLGAYKRDGKFDAKLGWTPRAGDEYVVSYVGQRGKKGNPPYAGTDPAVKMRYWQWPSWDKDSVYLLSHTRLGSSSYVRGRVFYDVYDNALYSFDDATYTTQVKPSSFQSLYHDNTAGGSVEFGTTRLPRQTLRAAGHFKNDVHHDRNVGEPNKDFQGHLMSFGVEDTVAVSSKVSLVAGISGDRQTTVKAVDYQKGAQRDLLADCATRGIGCGTSSGINPQAGLFYAALAGMLRGTVAHKTRMPSLKDRYSYKFGTAIPNPDLTAERATTVEAGYQGAIGTKASFQASLFYSRINDLIQSFPVSAGITQQRNIGAASSAGVELDVRTLVLPRLDLGGNYTYLERKNISDPAVRLVDTPRHKGIVSAILTPMPAVRIMVNIEYEQGRWTLNDASHYLAVPGFAIVSAKGIWTIRKKLDLEAGIFNAFDRYYWVADGYPEAGRTVMANLRWRF